MSPTSQHTKVDAHPRTKCMPILQLHATKKGGVTSSKPQRTRHGAHPHTTCMLMLQLHKVLMKKKTVTLSENRDGSLHELTLLSWKSLPKYSIDLSLHRASVHGLQYRSCCHRRQFPSKPRLQSLFGQSRDTPSRSHTNQYYYYIQLVAPSTVITSEKATQNN